MQVLDVEGKDIERLDQYQLTELLGKLLHLEARAEGIPGSAAYVSLEINVPDGGEDGRVRWEGQPEYTDYIPSRFTVFQCKATDMPPRDCEKEIIVKDGTVLKPQVAEVLDETGTYILFYGRQCTQKGQATRIERFRKALKDKGRADWNKADIRIYDTQTVAQWTNKFASAILYVHEANGRSIPQGLRTWEAWSQYEDNTTPYVPNDLLRRHIDQLRAQMGKTQGVARIIGLSGLGKTRLAFEAFRPPEGAGDPVQQSLSDRVVYFDAAGETGSHLTGLLGDMIANDKDACFVIDNCDAALHKQLAREVGRADSHLSLLTIDFQAELQGPPCAEILLRPNDLENVVKEMIGGAYKGLGRAVVDRICEFAHGFPQIAVLLARGVAGGITDSIRLRDSELVRRMLWGRHGEDRSEICIIQACSLVDHFEFTDQNKSPHIKFLAKEVAKVDEDLFYRTCVKFWNRGCGILQRRGHFARVTPTPLAMALAAEWWESIPLDEAKEIIAKIPAAGLTQEFCDQMRYLNFSAKPKQIVEQLCGASGPFGDAAVVCSEQGSAFMRSLASVNPEATAEGLYRIFSSWIREQLLDVRGEVRRNLVWTLEQLCWWKETFAKAARLLLAFACAENETWSTNATALFLQLFHIYLPGTQASLDARYGIIEDALEAGEHEKRVLGVRALGSALHTHSFMRCGGVESQGSRIPEKDYTPSVAEIHDYWCKCIQKLRDVACSDDALAELASQQLTPELSGLIDAGMANELDPVIRDIAEKRQHYWPEALHTLQKRLLLYEANKKTKGNVKVQEWIDALTPRGIRERLRLIVGIPAWLHKEKKEGQWVDLSDDEARRLAEELAGCGASWYGDMEVVFEGEQRKGFVFGKRLGELTADRQTFVNSALQCLEKTPADQAESIVLGGFLNGADNRSLTTSVLERIAANDALVHHLPGVTARIGATEDDLQRVAALVRERRVAPEYLHIFSYGRALDDLPDEAVQDFCLQVAQIEPQGTLVAMSILDMYCHGLEARFMACESSFRQMLMCGSLLSVCGGSQMGMHHWGTLVRRLLQRRGEDGELVKHILGQILRLLEGRDSVHYAHDGEIRTVVAVILDKFSEAGWPILGAALMSKDGMLAHGVGYLLQPQTFDTDKDNILGSFPPAFLIDWCGKDRRRASVIARIMPLLEGEGDETSWHPIAKSILDEFGEVKEVQRAVAGNMLSFGWSGSAVPQYERRIALLRELLEHPKKQIRQWAASFLDGLERSVREERIHDEEGEWGISGR